MAEAGVVFRYAVVDADGALAVHDMHDPSRRGHAGLLAVMGDLFGGEVFAQVIGWARLAAFSGRPASEAPRDDDPIVPASPRRNPIADALLARLDASPPPYGPVTAIVAIVDGAFTGLTDYQVGVIRVAHAEVVAELSTDGPIDPH